MAWQDWDPKLLELAQREGKLLAPVSPGALSTRFLYQVLALADRLVGGFGEQNRFSMVPQLGAVLHLLQAGGTRRLVAAHPRPDEGSGAA